MPLRLTLQKAQVEIVYAFREATGGTKIVEGINCRPYKGLRLLFQALRYRVLRIFEQDGMKEA